MGSFNMSENPFNSVKGIFNRNPKINNQKDKNVVRNNRQGLNLKNQNLNLNPNQIKKAKQMQASQNNSELSEMDAVLMKRMREIENSVGKLVADIQYLDSKNPAVSSKMTGMLAEMITTLWKIGNIAINYQENNQLNIVNNFLAKQEQKLLKFMENPKVDALKVNQDLDEIRTCQKIVNDSLYPLNSVVEYYNVLMSKLSGWGFEIKNPIGQKYDAHMDIDVLTFEDANPNFKEPTITETKRPEIYFNNKKILKALVVVTRAGA